MMHVTYSVQIQTMIGITWIVLILLPHLALGLGTCPRFPDPVCKGPFVIRPSRKSMEEADGSTGSGQCFPDQASAMESCLVQCQKDECCRAFGLDTSGKCVTSYRSTEELHFVKELNVSLKAICLKGKHNINASLLSPVKLPRGTDHESVSDTSQVWAYGNNTFYR